MFNRKPKIEETTDLEDAITNLISELAGMEGGSEEYTAAVANLKVLMETRAIEDQIEKPWRPSADVVATVTGNILGIIAILGFEKANVITSKGLALVIKPKI